LIGHGSRGFSVRPRTPCCKRAVSPSGRAATLAAMFLVTVTCTDPGCLAELDLVVAEVEEAEACCCDGCGCCVMVVAVAECEPEPALALALAA
jgi:hypothetical protein